MHTWQVSALPSAPQPSEIDTYRFPGARDIDEHAPFPPADTSDDYLLPSPDPNQRLPFALPAADKRRLDVHAALTTTGIPPLPGDLDAIKALCTLDDRTLTTVLRWITSY
ncbi:hypothetical protein [Streptomyces lunaelactis]|uniref:hypothetical protein n=1 Tax=Streptomyces lunaelactis TaxID=1535768 RepID=UPI001C2F7D9D|nr:hypothetical protein [Streptomyces lunaelactis]